MAEEVLSHGGKRETYTEFVEKFKPKKTTDDCMTPVPVYEAVADWVANEYGLDRDCFVRPFWPGGDYENYDYPEGCVVVDNPPFSLSAKIYDFYDKRGIKFFLFAPTLVIFTRTAARFACLICGAQIEYANGAKVQTSFVTNLEDDTQARTVPDLCSKLESVVADLHSKNVKALPQYAYPDEVVTAAQLNYLSKYGVDYKFTKNESHHVHALDAQKPLGKVIYGLGFILSEKAAAEKAAAEKAAAEKAAAEKAAAEKAAAEKKNAIVWELSEREKEIVKSLGKGA